MNAADLMHALLTFYYLVCALNRLARRDKGCVRISNGGTCSSAQSHQTRTCSIIEHLFEHEL